MCKSLFIGAKKPSGFIQEVMFKLGFEAKSKKFWGNEVTNSVLGRRDRRSEPQSCERTCVCVDLVYLSGLQCLVC